MIADLRFAIRSFARAKTTTAVLLVSLAFGTGANAALYSVIHALLFAAPAGLADPSRLAKVFTAQFNGGERGFTSYLDYLSIKASSPSFESLAAFDDSRFETVRLDGAAPACPDGCGVGRVFQHTWRHSLCRSAVRRG